MSSQSQRVLRSGNRYSANETTKPNTRHRKHLENEVSNEDHLHNEDEYGNQDNEDNEDMAEEESERNRLYPDLSSMHSQSGDDIVYRRGRAQSEQRREEQKKESPGKTETDGKGFGFVSTLLMVLSLFVALISSYYVFDGNRFWRNQTNGKNSMNRLSEWHVFENEFKTFELKYSEVLPEIGLKVLKTAVRNVMNRSGWTMGSVSPAIILMIASKDSPNVLRCIERDFVNIITKAYNESQSIRIYGKQTNSRDIIDKFEHNFGVDRKHTIVIESVESIAPKDVMSLHQFTDHQNAKFKEAIVVLTAIHFQSFKLRKGAQSSEMDSLATELFQTKWKNGLPIDQQMALISRLTTSVITTTGDKNTSAIKC